MPKYTVPELVAIDTETTGKDQFHGAAPFFVTMCEPYQNPIFWPWRVDPKTRKVLVNKKDLLDIRDRIDEAGELVGQNIKFDARALELTFAREGVEFKWPWHKTHDTLIASHILASNLPHDLGSLTSQYLGKDISKLEKKLKEACTKARGVCRRKTFVAEHGEWRIAKAGLPEMPSAKAEAKVKSEQGLPKTSPWAYDMWLPYELMMAWEQTKDKERLEHNSWFTVLQEYSCADSTVTAALWPIMRKMLEERSLWKIYQSRMKLVPAIERMERRGVTISLSRLKDSKAKYQEESEEASATCIALSNGRIEVMSKSGQSKAIYSTVFEEFKILPTHWTKKGNPSLDKEALQAMQLTLEPRSAPLRFVNNLKKFRDCRMSLGYITSYQKFGIPEENGMIRLHPSVNPTATATLRTSSTEPNSQQIAKKPVETGESKEVRSAKYMFGPAKGREWWGRDYENIELRIPGYKSKQKELIDLFERPDDPPFYGKQHLLNFSLVYADLWSDVVKKQGVKEAGNWIQSKEGYKATWYQFIKNGDFAIQYNCGEATADRAFRRRGSYKILKSSFSRLEELNQQLIKFANKHGYVETLPDKTVDPERGYPLLCSRLEYGKVSPTLPLNYMVQGTACWAATTAIVRCDECLAQWRKEGFDAHLILYIHDELVFDFPKSERVVNGVPSNYWRIKELGRIMEESGDNIGIPLKVSVSYHPNNWGDEEKIMVA